MGGRGRSASACTPECPSNGPIPGSTSFPCRPELLPAPPRFTAPMSSPSSHAPLRSTPPLARCPDVATLPRDQRRKVTAPPRARCHLELAASRLPPHPELDFASSSRPRGRHPAPSSTPPRARCPEVAAPPRARRRLAPRARCLAPSSQPLPATG
jgi:hypothetical protein